MRGSSYFPFGVSPQVTVRAFVGMNKIEYNPRKSRHIKYLERRIVELHHEIFEESLFIATRPLRDGWEESIKDRRSKIQTKLKLQKKYRRRLNLLNL